MSNLGNSKKEATSYATKLVIIIPLVVLGENLQCQKNNSKGGNLHSYNSMPTVHVVLWPSLYNYTLGLQVYAEIRHAEEVIYTYLRTSGVQGSGHEYNYNKVCSILLACKSMLRSDMQKKLFIHTSRPLGSKALVMNIIIIRYVQLKGREAKWSSPKLSMGNGLKCSEITSNNYISQRQM